MEKSEKLQHLINIITDNIFKGPLSGNIDENNNPQYFDNILRFLKLRHYDNSFEQTFRASRYADMINDMRELKGIFLKPNEIEKMIFDDSPKNRKYFDVFVDIYQSNRLFKYKDLEEFLDNRFYVFSNDYQPKELKRKITVNLNEWKILAESANVDISTSIENISLKIKEIEKILDFDIIYQDIKITIESFLNFDKVIEDYKHNRSLTDNEDKLKETYAYFNELLYDDSKLFNKPNYFSLKGLIDENNLQQILNTINNEFREIYNKITESKNLPPLSMAEAYMRNQTTKTSLANFIEKKSLEFENNDLDLAYILEINTGINKEVLYGFKDDTILYKTKDNDYILPYDTTECIDIILDTFDDLVAFELRKKPTLKNLVLNQLQNVYPYINECLVMINTYLDNEDILKNNKFDLKKIEENYKNDQHFSNNFFEYTDDKMHSIITEHKINQYANSIASNKYKFLYNEETYKIAKELYELKVNVKQLQEMIGSKIASFRDPEDFNSALTHLLNTYNEFIPESIVNKAKNINAEIISNVDNLLIIEIKNFEQSKIMGSPSWCITRNRAYFDSYISDNGHQYFIYDFNKGSSDLYSMIGLTLNYDGAYNASHLKNDAHLDQVKAQKYQLAIIKNNLSAFPELDNKIKEILNLDEMNHNKTKKFNI